MLPITGGSLLKNQIQRLNPAVRRKTHDQLNLILKRPLVARWRVLLAILLDGRHQNAIGINTGIRRVIGAHYRRRQELSWWLNHRGFWRVVKLGRWRQASEVLSVETMLPETSLKTGTAGISSSNTSSPLASWSRNRAEVKLELER